MSVSISAFDWLANEMLRLYEEAELELLGVIATGLYVDRSASLWFERRYSKLTGIRSSLKKVLDDTRKKRIKLSEDCIATAFEYGFQGTGDEVSAFSKMLSFYRMPDSVKRSTRILLELNDVLDAADRTILRRVNDEYANIIGRTAALVSGRHITLQEAIKLELDQFARRGIVSFVDKSGRSWDMATYAEMATVTAVERAVLDGFVQSMQENGEDLAIVSSHTGACPLCVAWEGVVVSISGNNPSYPSLAEAQSSGLFHPRCWHHLRVYREGKSRPGRTIPKDVQPMTAEYSLRQKQRSYERKIRQWKRRMAVATDPLDERAAYAHVRLYQDKLRTLIRDNRTAKLSRKYWREGGTVKLSSEAKKIKPPRTG